MWYCSSGDTEEPCLSSLLLLLLRSGVPARLGVPPKKLCHQIRFENSNMRNMLIIAEKGAMLGQLLQVQG